MAKSNFIVRGGADFSNINKSLVQTQKQFTAFQSGISKSMKLVGSILGGIAIGKFVKDSTTMAMGVESSMDNISRNMGESSNVFQQWADTKSKYLGIAKAEAYSYGSTFSNLLGSFQSSTKETADSTQELMKASAIIASKTGKTYDDVANRIRSGMLGSTEAIEDLGVYTNVSMIESTIAFKKFANGKSWAQLDFKVQQQIRLAAILEQTYSRYGDTLANTTQSKQAMFLASLKNIQLNIGQAFLPIYNIALPALTSLANKLETLTSMFSAFSQSFFGKAITIQTSEIEDSTGAIEGLGDAAETAGKQAKKSIAPFNELNQISSSSGGSNGSSGGIGTGSGAKPPTTTITDVDTGFTKGLEKLKDVIEPTEKALGRLKLALAPLGNLVFDNIKSFYIDTLVPIGKWVLGEGLPRLLDVGSGLLSSINWNKLSISLTSLNKAIAPFAINVGEGLIIFIETMGDIAKPVIATTTNLIADGINALAKGIKLIPSETAMAVGGAIGGIATSILLFNGATSAVTAIKSIKTNFPAMLSAITKYPLLTVAAGIGAIAGAAITLTEVRFNNSEIGKYVKHLNDLAKNAKEFNKEVSEMLASNDEKRKGIESEYAAVEILANKYFDLADKTSLSNQEQLLMKTYAEELVKAIPELNGMIDLTTGAYKGTKDEIIGLISKTKEYYLVQAAQESLIEIAKKQYEAEKNLKELQEERTNVQELLTEKQNEFKTAINETNAGMRTATDDVKKAYYHNNTLRKEIEELENTFNTLGTEIGETTTTINGLSTEWDYATDYILEYSGANDTTKKAIDNVKASVKETSNEIVKADIPGHAKKSIDGFNGYFLKDSTTNSAITSWLKGVNSTVSNWKVPDIKVAFSATTDAINEALKGYGMYNFNMPKPNIRGYATGGFPSAGELFIGNENGIEMMGRMGNQNVVANNQQIEAGIEEAAYRGFTRAMKDNSSSSNVSVILEGDANGLFKMVQQKSHEYIARTRKDPFDRR